MPKKSNRGKELKNIKLSLTDKRRLLRQSGYTPTEARNWGNRSNENVMNLVNKKRKQQGLKTLKPTTFMKAYKEELETGKKDWKSILSDLFINRKEVQSGYRPPKKKPNPYKNYPNETKLSKEGYKVYFAWKDNIDSFEGDVILMEKIRWENEDKDYLIQKINEILPTDGGYIGSYRLEIAKHPPNYNIDDMEDWTVIYGGNGKKQKTLLASINAILTGLYYSWQKALFVKELVQLMNKINPRTSKYLRDKLKYE